MKVKLKNSKEKDIIFLIIMLTNIAKLIIEVVAERKKDSRIERKEFRGVLFL